MQDYCTNINEEHFDLSKVVEQMLDLFQLLMKAIKNKPLARLLVKLMFVHVNQETIEIDQRSYLFPSFSSEKVVDVKEFYELHMKKLHIDWKSLTVMEVTCCSKVLLTFIFF